MHCCSGRHFWLLGGSFASSRSWQFSLSISCYWQQQTPAPATGSCPLPPQHSSEQKGLAFHGMHLQWWWSRQKTKNMIRFLRRFWWIDAAGTALSCLIMGRCIHCICLHWFEIQCLFFPLTNICFKSSFVSATRLPLHTWSIDPCGSNRVKFSKPWQTLNGEGIQWWASFRALCHHIFFRPTNEWTKLNKQPRFHVCPFWQWLPAIKLCLPL